VIGSREDTSYFDDTWGAERDTVVEEEEEDNQHREDSWGSTKDNYRTDLAGGRTCWVGLEHIDLSVRRHH